MRLSDNGSLKPVRGKVLPLDIHPHWTKGQVLAAAVKKQTDFHQDMHDGAHVLLYPDGREVITIPGTKEAFDVQKYKEAVGKAYQKITLYICSTEDFETSCKCYILYNIHGFIFRGFSLLVNLCKTKKKNLRHYCHFV